MPVLMGMFFFFGMIWQASEAFDGQEVQLIQVVRVIPSS